MCHTVIARCETDLKVSMHDEISIREPNILVVVDGVEKIVMRLIRVPQSRVIPLLLKQKLYFVFLKYNIQRIHKSEF